MGPMGTKSRLCLGCSSMVITGYAIGCQCPADSGRFIIPSTCATLRRLSSVCCSRRNRTGLNTGPPGPWCWHVDGQNVTGNMLMSNLYECHIWMPLICHKYIVHVYIYIRMWGICGFPQFLGYVCDLLVDFPHRTISLPRCISMAWFDIHVIYIYIYHLVMTNSSPRKITIF